LVTNARIFERPEPIVQAWHQVETWLDSPVGWIPQPTAGHRKVLGSLLVSHGARAHLVPDAHLAALAAEHAWCCARAIPILPASQTCVGSIR
jgi:hypothetical protein